MRTNLRQVVTAQLMRVEIVQQAAEQPMPDAPAGEGHHMDLFSGEDDFGPVMEADFGSDPADSREVAPEDRNPEDPSSWGKVGRNEPCPCGSGLKYKHCHGKLA